GAAHVLWERGGVGPEAGARFQTPSGRLSAARREGWIELDFPAAPASVEEAPTDLIASLGVSAKGGGRNRLDWLVEVESASVVRAVAPHLARLGAVPTRGVIVTAPADDTRADFVSRFFAPRAGIPED